MLAEGRGGLVSNMIDAYAWFSLAVENGVQPLGRDMVAQRLSSADLQKAKARLAQFQSGTPAIASTPRSSPTAPAPTSDPRDDSLRIKVDQLMAENAQLRAAQQQAQQQAEEPRTRLERELLDAVAATARLTEENKSLSEIRSSAKPGDSEDIRLVQARELNDRLNREVRRSTSELASLHRKLRIAEAKLRNQPDLASDASANRSSSDLATLQRELDEMREANQKLVSTAARLDAVGLSSDALKQLQTQAAAGSQARADLQLATQRNEQLAQALTDAQKARDAALAQKTDLERRLAAAADQGAVGEVASLNARLANTQGNLVAAMRETEEIRVQMQAAQGDLRVSASRYARELAAAQAKAGEADSFARSLEDSNRNLASQVNDLKKSLSNQTAQLSGNREISGQVESLQSELRGARESEQALQSRLDALTAERSREAATAGTANDQLSNLASDLRRAQFDLETALADKSRLADQVETLQRDVAGHSPQQAATNTANTRLKLLQAALTSAQSGAAEAMKQLQAVTTDRDQLAQAQQTLQAQISTLRRDLDLAKDQSDLNTGLEPKLTTANTRLASQEQSLDELTTANQGLLQSSAQLKSQLQLLQQENERLAAANRSFSSSSAMISQGKAGYIVEIDEAARVLAERNTAVADLTERVASLQQDLHNAQKGVAAALAAKSQAMQALPDSQALLLELTTLQSQVTQLENQLAQDRARSAKELSSLAEQLSLSSQTNQALSEVNRSLMRAQMAQKSTIQADLDDARSQLEKLAPANQQLTKERDEQSSQVSDLFSKLGTAEKQLATLRQNYASSANSATSAQTELSALQAKLAELDETVDRQSSSVAELTGINDRLGKDKAALTVQLARVQSEANQSQTELETLRKQLTEQRRLAAEQATSADQLKTLNAALQTRVDDFGARVAALSSEANRLGGADTEAARLGSELERVKTQLADHERTSQAQAAGSTKFAADNAALQQTLELVTARLAALSEENFRLAGVEAARSEAERQLASLSNASEQLAVAQRDLNAARTENTRLSNTLQAMERDRTSRIASLQQDNAALSTRLRQAQDTLDQIASAAGFTNSRQREPPEHAERPDEQHAHSGSFSRSRGRRGRFSVADQSALLRHVESVAGDLRGQPCCVEQGKRLASGSASRDSLMSAVFADSEMSLFASRR